MKQLYPILALALLALAGCANDPAPQEQMRLTQQAVEQARAVGADSALEDMQQAERKLARAEKNMAEEDYKRARILAEQAELNARLAEAKLLNQKSQRQLDELNKQITRLRTQLGELP